ncbi:MAG: hypothetical protein JWO52_1751 [Gammaproteobacteria bacterium]|nr:hypothetical protein [Gammaproteobacteria bacterium]
MLELNGQSRARRIMRLVRPWALLSVCLACWASSAVGRPAIDELAATYDFLVSYRSTHGGALYKQTSGLLKSLVLPFSFYDSGQYWGEYVCALPEVNCAVTDYYDATDYAVKPQKGEGALLQTERVNVHNGTNIYDAATWQIGVILGATVNKFRNSLDVDPYELATNQNRVLSGIRSTPNMPSGSRAVTVGNLYGYNGHSVADPKAAYAFRMTAATWLTDDPLRDTRHASLVSVTALPDNPAYEAGRIAWSDWKPITGDNAWAFLVGPLHTAYIHYIVGQGGKYVPFEEQSVQNALAVLPTFAAMQSPSGAVYYAPSGTLQNGADRPVNPHYVSVENNLSLYAGLRILQHTLCAQLTEQRNLKPADQERIGNSLTLIGTMIAGSASRDGPRTRGLLAFFKEAAWRDGEFVQGGLANDPRSKDEWVPLLQPKAVDVNTWGVAALGSTQIDRWFGFGAAYRVWKRLKAWGAYGTGHTISGVGYSDQDGNGQNDDGTFRSGVMSSEWTAGAIVMVRNMIERYRSVPKSSPDHADALRYEAALREDERHMLDGLQELRLNRYAKADFPGKPGNYARLIVEPTNPVRSEPYVYSSKRYRIPFGWYGNPIPSTSSTAWIILIADEYDPFGYGGKPN